MKHSNALWGAFLIGLGIGGCQTQPVTAPDSLTLNAPRVVSLTPNLTEILFALEAGPQVVGVTRNDHFPAEVEKLPKVGDLQLNYEALLSLRPDLVVYDPLLHQQHQAHLQRLGLKLQPLPSRNLSEMLESIQILGQSLGRESQAQKLVEQLRAELDGCRARARALKHHPTALLEIWPDPLTAAGRETYCSDVIELAGFRNVVPQGNFPVLSLEEVFRLNPEVLICTHPLAHELKTKSAWSQLDAVKHGRVVEVPEDWLVRPGPRVVDALHRLQTWLEQHPLNG